MIHESQLRPKALVFDDMEKDQVIAEGVPEEQGKFCADCKHLIGVRYNKESQNWNCGHPNNDLGFSVTNLVTGIKTRIFKHKIYLLREYDLIDREEACGPAGKWYEKYTPPDYSLVDTIGGEEPVIFDEAAMAEGKAAAEKRLAEIKARRGK